MNLLITGCFEYSNAQIKILESLGFTVYFMQQEKDELPLLASNVDAVVCNGLFLSHDIDQFSRLKFIQLTSAGFDRVPVDIIKSNGIQLYNARGVYSIPMAEWAIFRVLECYKQGWFFHQEQISGRWTKHRGLREITGIKVAVVGAGNVGQEVAKRFQAFGAETTGFDIHVNETLGFHYMALTETFRKRVGEFDVVIITAPLLPSTIGLINRDVLMAMKENAVIINIARGGLIDQHALIDVLLQRPDLFAALDVFEVEPLPENNPLWKMKNVAVSPHNSFVSDGNNSRMFEVIYGNLKNFINN
ncbi:NAD(P)-dependent oxidoreductase [Bacteroides eggerthii]|jgi:phosphoglycerate dehydrogenase-like enzyme|uniref:NAD(P)-dependent oxidoreductase n=1 Tax=Bacteroides eggerthii TaxID=28111 RepID=A0ABT7U325_9BACE|nr:NAD(P)-dependent oxidoreductase [Bacteroides eggerthii]